MDFGIYSKGHVFETPELASFLVTFIAGSLELGKELAMGCFKTLSSLRCGGLFQTQSDVCDGAFCENSLQQKAVGCFCRNLGLLRYLTCLLITSALVCITQIIYFEFNSKTKQQISGTAIGTKFAPPYACIFMDKVQTEFLDKELLKPWVWLKYIDGIFFVWIHGEESLQQFLEHLNDFHPGLRFTYEISAHQVNFLDVLLNYRKMNFRQTYIVRRLTVINIFIMIPVIQNM